jgi:hypothetical protein
VAQRLEVIAHGPSTGMTESIFGDAGSLLNTELITPIEGRVKSWRRGPEAACAATTAALGGAAEVVDGLRSCDYGSWVGRTLGEIEADDRDGLRQWLHDPYASPHGGESLAQLVSRVGATIEQLTWPEGWNVVVTNPLVARAMVVHLLAAEPAMIFRIDVSPLGRILASRSGKFWRLQFGPRMAGR